MDEFWISASRVARAGLEHGFRGEHAARRGLRQVGQARGLVDGIADDRVLEAGLGTDVAGHRSPARDADGRVVVADVLVVGTPIWLGEKSSVCTRLIERLYGNSGQLNAEGQWMDGRGGPGPSYADPGAGGPQNAFTQRNTVFAAWNLMHLAALLKRAGSFPAHGNQRALWDAGSDFDHPNPEYR